MDFLSHTNYVCFSSILGYSILEFIYYVNNDFFHYNENIIKFLYLKNLQAKKIQRLFNIRYYTHIFGN